MKLKTFIKKTNENIAALERSPNVGWCDHAIARCFPVKVPKGFHTRVDKRHLEVYYYETQGLEAAIIFNIRCRHEGGYGKGKDKFGYRVAVDHIELWSSHDQSKLEEDVEDIFAGLVETAKRYAKEKKDAQDKKNQAYNDLLEEYGLTDEEVKELWDARRKTNRRY